MLLFLSYDVQTAPEEISFAANDANALNYIKNTQALGGLFSHIVAGNSLTNGRKHTNYLLSDSFFETVEHDEHFRKKEHDNFFNTYIQPCSGTICFEESGQYVYMLLGNDETKFRKNIDGQYIAIALFKENIFIGFEEGLIKNNTCQVLATGFYPGSLEPGVFLSFIIVFLSYLHKHPHLAVVNTDLNKTKETIYHVE